MPAHLVDRINASLIAEQAERATKLSGASVSPLLTSTERRPRRLLLTAAGAAAAVALVAVVGTNVFSTHQRASTSSGAAAVITASRTQNAQGARPLGAGRAPSLAGRVPTPSLVQISLSTTQYTEANFVSQVQALRRTAFQPPTAQSPMAGPAGTVGGLTQCLNAIGAGGALTVRADVAFYKGEPAVVIVATTSGITLAYVVGRQCSPTDTTELRPATPLP